MSKKPASLDELIARKAEEFADQVRAAAAMADKEEEIRIEVERQLAFVEKEAGVKLEGRHEFTVAKGRVDSVYDRVLIEYKNPSSPGARIGPGASSPGAKKVVEQIKQRFYDLRTKYKDPLNTLFGVGCDGKHFIFVRYYNDKWQVQDPVEVNKHSTERFLWALFNLGTKGKRFEPDYLAGDFGSAEGSVASSGIKVLYHAICATDNPKALTFFNQWKILFGEVCGYDVDNPSDKIKKLADFYGVPVKNVKPAELLFSVHTYYALFMKLLAAQIMIHFHKLPGGSLVEKLVGAPTAAKLKSVLEDLEQGGVFRHLGITNFLEGDLFAWYLPAWSQGIEDVIRALAMRLDQYNPGTLAEEPQETRDFLKKLYQQLFPKSVRHDLGEYYTPDWLAEHVLNEVGYVGDPDKRLLDPACGSGTFLVMAITRIRSWYEKNREKCRYDEGELCKKILANVIGFDLNPLAVMAARTNYLIAIRDLVSHVDKVEIPVYLCDSILTPSSYGGLFAGTTTAAKELKTSAAKFLIPTEIATNREDVAKYAEQLEFCVRNGYEPKEFVKRCQDEGLPVTAQSLHLDLYRELVKLDKANKNGVWARIIKNAFAPLFIGRVDYVAGNPPWVVWDNLPSDYRDSTKPIWEGYGLFTLSASAARHGGGKKDLSMLMLYVSADCYLADAGRLGFVITQTLFQTKGAGDGFRRFRLGDAGAWLGVLRVDDMVRFQPFEGAANWTSTVTLQKGIKTTWPVPYFKWSLIDDLPESNLDNWREGFAIEPCTARPIDQDRENAPWMVSPAGIGTDVAALVGPSDYSAHAGAYSGGANGVYWVRILKKLAGGVLVENVSEKSKAGIKSVTAAIEPDLLYPLIRWSDVSRFHAEPSVYLVLAQNVETRTGIQEPTMRSKWPKTYAYLKQFQSLLVKRAAYKRYQGDAPFYSMYDIDTYTLAPIKVVWRRMDRQINAAVVESVKDPVLGKRPVVPQETCVLIEAVSTDEAHYICAMLNSAVANFLVKSHSVRGGKGFGTPSMLDYIPIKRFDGRDRQHKHLAALSYQAHEAAAGDADYSKLQDAIDESAAALFGLSNSDAAVVAKLERE